MSDIPEPQKIIPQYTIRWLLGLTTVWGMIFSIVAFAIRGHIWAVGITVAIGSLAAFMLVCALLYSLVWICSQVAVSRKTDSASGKFAPVEKEEVLKLKNE
jgi:hypothetical protein